MSASNDTFNVTFHYTTDGSGRMTIYHHHRAVKTIKGKLAHKLSEKLLRADEKEQQRLMAAATGNYKRGNEKN